jgi:acetyltransferase-like isoleucine patch superfamily enzyme
MWEYIIKPLAVTRELFKDKSSSFNRRKIDLFRSWWYLKRSKNIITGKNIAVRSNIELRMCSNAKFEIGDNCIINEYVFLQLTKPNPYLRIGNWVTLGRFSAIACKGQISIGDYTQIGANCYLVDQNHAIKKNDLILNQHAEIGEIDIGRDCWIGAYVKILPNVKIGNGVVVGSGSVVTKNIPDYAVVVGNPAKIIKYRL